MSLSVWVSCDVRKLNKSNIFTMLTLFGASKCCLKHHPYNSQSGSQQSSHCKCNLVCCAASFSSVGGSLREFPCQVSIMSPCDAEGQLHSPRIWPNHLNTNGWLLIRKKKMVGSTFKYQFILKYVSTDRIFKSTIRRIYRVQSISVILLWVQQQCPVLQNHNVIEVLQ